MDKTEKRRFLFVSVFSLIAIMIVCGFAVAATNDELVAECAAAK